MSKSIEIITIGTARTNSKDPADKNVYVPVYVDPDKVRYANVKEEHDRDGVPTGRFLILFACRNAAEAAWAKAMYVRAKAEVPTITIHENTAADTGLVYANPAVDPSAALDALLGN